MVERANARVASSSSSSGCITAVVGDAAAVPPGAPYAVILSVFGLQQLPDPPKALLAWCNQGLAPGGLAIVCFWPSSVEAAGPWQRYGEMLKARLPPSSNSGSSKWELELGAACSAAGLEILCDEAVPNEIVWDSPQAFWEAMTRHGPWHAARLRRGDEFINAMREEFLRAYQADKPLAHNPAAHLLAVRRPRPGAAL